MTALRFNVLTVKILTVIERPKNSTGVVSRGLLAILTPTAAEFEAVRSKLDRPDPCSSHGLRIERGIIGPHSVLLVLCGKGQANAAAAAQYVIDAYGPSGVMLVGIAGGFPDRDVQRGDVVVPHFVRHLDYGKLTPGKFVRRPDFDYAVDRKLLALAELLAERNTVWRNDIGVSRPDGVALETSSVHVGGSLASSDKVIDSKGGVFAKLRFDIPEIDAVDMESIGVGAAVRLAQTYRSLPLLIVRGISDEPSSSDAGFQGSLQRREWKQYASRAAAAFLKALLLELPILDHIGTDADSLGFRHECRPCRGRGYYGANPKDSCPVCSGKGNFYVQGTRNHFRQCRVCSGCGHYRHIQKNTCVFCKGWGIVRKTEVSE